MTEQARLIASLFRIAEPFTLLDFPNKGNINQQTYLITSGASESRSEYLLQLLNPEVFKQPRRTMDAMIACIQAQQEALARGLIRDREEWEAIALVPTLDDRAWLEIETEGGTACWRMMVKIPNARTYKSLNEIAARQDRVRIAQEAGTGLAFWGNVTAGMDPFGLERALPGYRDTRLYYDQLFSVLAGSRSLEEAAPYLPEDPSVRETTEEHFLIHLPVEEFRGRVEDRELQPFIALAREYRSFALTLSRELLSGKLRTVVVHGDTKLENFLFSTRTGRVKALVDLDTIMPHTWLTDWGDMVRSLVNTAGEKERSLKEIVVDTELFRAAAQGFLGAARGITMHEVEVMVDAVQIMALELGVRFLADFLRGDTYFKPCPDDHSDINKSRAMAQLTLFEKLRAADGVMRDCIENLSRSPSEN